MKAWMSYYKIGYEAKTPEQRLVGYILALWGYMSSGSKLDGAVETFASDASAVLDTLLGLTTSAYVGYNIITSAVNVEATGTDRYKDYGVHGPLGAFLGLFQGLWVVSFLMLCAGMAMAPVKMALDFKDQEVAENDALYYHTLQTFATYVGYYTITEAKTHLFGVFDNGALNPDYGEDVSNTIGLTWDLVNHSLVAMGYSVVALSVSLGPFFYAEFLMDPEMFPGWMQKYVLE